MPNVAWPPDKVPEPICVALSMKFTVPVGVPPVLVTVALKVTLLPYDEGLGDDVTLVVVDAGFTVCERGVEDDPVNVVFPA